MLYASHTLCPIIRFDIMHNVYHGGCGSDLAASVIIECCLENNFGAGDLATQLRRAHFAHCSWLKQTGWAASNGSPKQFTRGRFNYTRNKDQATMTTRYKAAHVKTVCIWLHVVAAANVDSEYKRLRAACCYALSTWITLLDSAPLLLSDAQVTEAQRLGYLFLRSYQRLAAESLILGKTLYKIRPKFHAFEHTIENLANKENPRYFSCFLDEDLMGKVARVAGKCHPFTMMERCLTRKAEMLDERWTAKAKSMADARAD